MHERGVEIVLLHITYNPVHKSSTWTKCIIKTSNISTWNTLKAQIHRTTFKIMFIQRSSPPDLLPNSHNTPINLISCLPSSGAAISSYL